MKLGIDLDGVLCDFAVPYANLFPRLKIPTEAPDFPPCWDYPEFYGATTDEVNAAWRTITASGNFWVKLLPYETAWNDIRNLNWAAADGHEVYYITTRPGTDVKGQTERWLKRMGVTLPTVLLSSKKYRVADGLDLDVMVEDRACNLEFFPATCRSFLFDRPHNQESTKYERVTSVTEALQKVGIDYAK